MVKLYEPIIGPSIDSRKISISSIYKLVRVIRLVAIWRVVSKQLSQSWKSVGKVIYIGQK